MKFFWAIDDDPFFFQPRGKSPLQFFSTKTELSCWGPTAAAVAVAVDAAAVVAVVVVVAAVAAAAAAAAVVVVAVGAAAAVVAAAAKGRQRGDYFPLKGTPSGENSMPEFFRPTIRHRFNENL